MTTAEVNQQLSSLPGYTLCEYQLVLQPHEELRNKINKVRGEFAEKYKIPGSPNGAIHISLARFTQLQMMEDRLCNRFRMIAMAMPAFKVALNGFASFPTHTLYINVESKAAVQMVTKQLKTAQRLMKTAEHKPHFIDDPFIPVALKLLPWQYEQGWLEYSHRQFSGRFIAKSMQLLRRFQGGKAYQPIKHFEFLNMPVVTMQGQLF